jgi:hypothetical protein
VTSEEILAAIDSDPIAFEMARHGDDSGCAARLVAILPKIQGPVAADDVLLIAARRGRWGPIALTCENQQADFALRSVCKTFVDWTQAKRSIDFDLPSVQMMISVLISASLITESDVSEIKTYGQEPHSITAMQVSQAMEPRRPEGKI